MQWEEEVEHIRKKALENYNTWGHVVVETFSDEEIVEVLEEEGSEKKALIFLKGVGDAFNERVAECCEH